MTDPTLPRADAEDRDERLNRARVWWWQTAPGSAARFAEVYNRIYVDRAYREWATRNEKRRRLVAPGSPTEADDGD